MGYQVNIAEAKAKLSELLDRALGGEEIVIARAGKLPREAGAAQANMARGSRRMARVGGGYTDRSVPRADG